MKTIKFTVSRLGQVSMDVQGATGSSCKDLTRPYEAALGGITETTTKPEMEQVDLGGQKEEQGTFAGGF